MTDVAVVFGGPSPEHDISVSTGLQATRVLEGAQPIYWDKTGVFHLVDVDLEMIDFADGVPRKSRELRFVAQPGGGWTDKKKTLGVGVAVLCTHGGPGEDGTLQGALDLAGIRYTGPGRWGSALGMDKLAFGAAVEAAGLPTLPRVPLGLTEPGFEPPYIIKPRFGGSSIGIEVAEDLATARALMARSPHLADGAVLEPYLTDFRDLQVGVRTYPEVSLSAIEEPARAPTGIYSYEQKYLAWGDGGVAQRKLPADVDLEVESRLRASAVAVAQLVGLRSVGRVDFLEVGSKLFVNEVNTIPGSLAAYLWVDPPVSRAELLAGLVEEARSLPPRRFSTAGADGSALRNAGTIANKLG